MNSTTNVSTTLRSTTTTTEVFSVGGKCKMNVQVIEMPDGSEKILILNYDNSVNSLGMDKLPTPPASFAQQINQTTPVNIEMPVNKPEPVVIPQNNGGFKKPATNNNPPAPSAPKNNNMSDEEMRAEIKKLGYKKKGLHFCKTDTLKQILSDLQNNPAPQQSNNTPPAPQNNGGGFKGGKGGAGKKPMPTVIVESGKLKPCKVWNKSKDKVLPLPNRTLFYMDESVEDNGLKVFSPDDNQDGIATGYLKCSTWFVVADNVIEM
jgi:hypothetical protein